MLSETSLVFISFINYFLVPVISVRIYCKRHLIDWKCTAELFYRYVVMCVLNLPLGRICASVVGKNTGSIILAESTKYTIIALLVAVVVPYAIEVVEKLIQADVEISKIEKQKKSEK